MSNLLLRKMTLKSVLDAGKYKGMQVGDVMKMSKIYLIYTYFTYSKLTFTDEVLDILNIEPADRIAKPGCNPSIIEWYKNRNLLRTAGTLAVCVKQDKNVGFAVLSAVNKKNKRRDIANYNRRDKIAFSKGSMQARNHK